MATQPSTSGTDGSIGRKGRGPRKAKQVATIALPTTERRTGRDKWLSETWKRKENKTGLNNKRIQYGSSFPPPNKSLTINHICTNLKKTFCQISVQCAFLHIPRWEWWVCSTLPGRETSRPHRAACHRPLLWGGAPALPQSSRCQQSMQSYPGMEGGAGDSEKRKCSWPFWFTTSHAHNYCLPWQHVLDSWWVFWAVFYTLQFPKPAILLHLLSSQAVSASLLCSAPPLALESLKK